MLQLLTLCIVMPAIAASECQVPLVGSVNLPSYPINLTVVDDYAYVAGTDGGLHIVDISDPAAPDVVGIYATTTDAIDVVVQQGVAYVAAMSAGLLIIDVSEPSMPTLLATVPTQSNATTVVSDARFAYVGAHDLTIVNIEVPTAPTVVGFWQSHSFIKDLAVGRDTIYAGELWQGLAVIDVSDHTQPAWLAGEEHDRVGDLIAYHDRTAYVMDNDGIDGLRILDVSDPAAPATMGILYDVLGNGIALAPGRVFTVLGCCLQVVDVTNPGDPSFVLEFHPLDEGVPNAIAVRDGLAYIASFGAPHVLRIYDISDCLPVPCPADIDGDGKVDPFDSNACMARFGCDVNGDDPLCATCDLDGDGVVNPFDSNTVMAAFGDCP